MGIHHLCCRAGLCFVVYMCWYVCSFVSLKTGNPLEFLRQLPQFNMLRQVVQQNPSMLQALLQQIGQSNPRLLQVRGGGVTEELI